MRCTVVGMLLVVAAAAGCAKPQARTMPEPPPLDVPAVPPRVIAAAETDAPEPDVARDETPPASVRPTRPPPAKPPATKETAKPEPPRLDVAPPPETASETRPTPPQLRTPQTVSNPQMERKVRDTLTRAGRLLNGVDYNALPSETKVQYDTAKRFMTQADEALKEKNYVFAIYLADKAETIAKALPR
jgi:hypothetical protein